jgi:ketosteroid isomerase-like protein
MRAQRKELAMVIKDAVDNVENIVQTLRRAHEERDIDLVLGLYSEHAEIRVVDHASPPDSPRVFRGEAQIAEYFHHLYGQQMSHHVGAALQDVVMGEGRISVNVTREDAQGSRLLAAESYEVHRGRIVFQTNVETS